MPSKSWIGLATLALGVILQSAAGAPMIKTRIHGAIENNRRVALSGHLHPRAEAADDTGMVEPSEELPGLTLVLRQTEEQQAALTNLLAEQQDPSSPNYHHWLTPEEYAARFGVSDADIATLRTWLEGQDLKVTGVARARNQIWFSGTAGAVGKAFGTEFHRYQVNGKLHFANATEPSIPVALDVVVRGIRGLNDFRMKPRSVARRSDIAGTPVPEYTTTGGNHYLSPDDLAAIYNVKPLHNAGFRGAGQKIVIPGQTQIDLADIQQFRTRFNLPAGDPDVVLVPNTKDPGRLTDDMGEADLDIEWASALAPEAKIVYVYSSDVMDAVQYAIDQNLAPVLSLSYGLCESLTSRADALTMQSWARQANVQGMTWMNASGDAGGADCVTSKSTNGGGLSVDAPASIPEVTGVGGTTFSEGGGSYWAASNGANGGSVTGYIPEAVWNDSEPQSPASGGGGASAFFAKPDWQNGAGVPANQARNVPDVSLNASADHDGYMVYSAGKLSVFGGTSAAAPAFAGIITLLNQYLVANGAQSTPGVGNINPKLYSLAQTTPAAFHDVVDGHNIVTVTCGTRSRNCVSGSFGFNASPGYDQASGLGSVDAWTLVTNWRNPAGSVSRGTATLSLTSSATTITRNDAVTLTAQVTGNNGGTPTGSVTFSLGTTSLGTVTLDGAGTSSITIGNSQLAAGNNAISAAYSGDSTYTAANASVTINVTGVSGVGNPSISGLANAASFLRTFAPGMLVSVFGADLAPVTMSASSVPLPVQLAGVSATINGVPTPLQFVSPGQVNLQVPYQTSVFSTAQLVLTNNGRSTSATFPVGSAAPGIFTASNGDLIPISSARRGQTVEVYLTGAGVVYPSIANGATPPSSTSVARLPVPVQSARVSIGGVTAPISFMGISPGLVGVVQMNIVVPSGAPSGRQPLVVTMGGVSSVAAALNVVNN